jgi:uncharacterized membrane protein YfcA
MIQIFELLALGALVGFGSSVFGIGGGVVVAPLLPFILPIESSAIVGTSLICIFLTVGTNTYFYARKGLVKHSVAIKFGILGSIGSFGAAFFAPSFPGRAVQIFTVGLLAFIFVLSLMRQKFKSMGANEVTRPRDATGIKVYLPSGMESVVGIGAGVCAGVTGIGAGVLLSPLFLIKAIVTELQIAPTLNAVIVVTSFVGGVNYYLHGSGLVLWNVVGWVFLGSVVSSYFGRRIQLGMTSKQRHNSIVGFIGFICLLSAARIVWSMYYE